ncbi:MAG: hypothetical protein E6R06_13995 [Mycobacterium sp.]|nr:MAG: hypothetical protein E6R06_13995 [Mycobacterium sp.]
MDTRSGRFNVEAVALLSGYPLGTVHTWQCDGTPIEGRKSIRRRVSEAQAGVGRSLTILGVVAWFAMRGGHTLIVNGRMIVRDGMPITQ